MRKLLIAATMLVPFAAFAGNGGAPIGIDADLAKSSAMSTAGVQGSQGTAAKLGVAGNGGAMVGAVSGNYTSVTTTALGRAGLAGSYTGTTATQANIGGTIAGGLAINKAGSLAPMTLAGGKGQAGGMTGNATGTQNSQATGSSGATASSINLGGATSPKPTGHGR